MLYKTPILEVSRKKSARKKEQAMETAFNIGDIVKANVKAQGMTKDRLYVVEDIRSEYIHFGNFVTYTLRDGAKVLEIGNGHFLLSKVG